MDTEHRSRAQLTRRCVLAGLTGAGLAAAGCSSGGDPPPEEEPTPAGLAGKVVIALSQLPEGRTVSAKDPAGRTLLLLRTGPQAVTALSARCTHQGCTVAAGAQTLDCPCHGSLYQPGTGAVVNGPAKRPLTTVAVKIDNGEVVLV